MIGPVLMSNRLGFTCSTGGDDGESITLTLGSDGRNSLLAYPYKRLWLRDLLPPGGGVLDEDEKDPEGHVE